GRVAVRREERRDDAEVDGRLVDLQTAGDVDVDVAGHEVAAGALLEDGQEQRYAVGVDADGHAPRRGERRRRDEGLHLDEQRPRPFHGRDDGRAGCRAALREERGGRIRHFFQTVVVHLVDRHFVHGAEAVLDGTDDAVVL